MRALRLQTASSGAEAIVYLGKHVGWLSPRAGRWWWVIGECRGDEETRSLAIAVLRRYLGDDRAPEQGHMETRISGASSRRPGAGPTVGQVWVTKGPSLQERKPVWIEGLVPGSPDWMRAGAPVPPKAGAA